MLPAASCTAEFNSSRADRKTQPCQPVWHAHHHMYMHTHHHLHGCIWSSPDITQETKELPVWAKVITTGRGMVKCLCLWKDCRMLQRNWHVFGWTTGATMRSWWSSGFTTLHLALTWKLSICDQTQSFKMSKAQLLTGGERTFGGCKLGP